MVQIEQMSISKRYLLLFISLAFYYVVEFYIHPTSQGYINIIRDNFLVNHKEFSSHLLHTLPRALILLAYLYLLIFLKLLPKPYVFKRSTKLLKESIIWGLATCTPVIPVALSFGYKIGIQLKLEKALGDIFSNTYEEVVYRLFLFWVIKSYTKNQPLAVFSSALFFAYTHDQYPWQIQITVFTAGVFLSLAYIRTKNILAPIFAHQIADMILDNILIK